MEYRIIYRVISNITIIIIIGRHRYHRFDDDTERRMEWIQLVPETDNCISPYDCPVPISGFPRRISNIYIYIYVP